MKETIKGDDASRNLAYYRRNKEKVNAYKKEDRARRKSEGICYTCPNPAAEGKVTCEVCAIKNKASFEKTRQRRIEAGECYQCGGIPTLGEGNGLCIDCWYKKKATDNLGSPSRWQELKDKLESQNFTCPYTGKKLIPGTNASVDHIFPSSTNPELEFEISNVEWVDTQFNRIKSDLNPDQFFHMAVAVLVRRFKSKLGVKITLLLSKLI
jgi:hypothetical protein